MEVRQGAALGDIAGVLRAQLHAALWECTPPRFAARIVASDGLDNVVRDLTLDAEAYQKKDPACQGDPLTVIRAYTSFKAVLHYRLAHALCKGAPAHCWGDSSEMADYASIISSRGKLLSGADIHHRSQVGRRFVLDHGVGTVIGETTEIGDDCYILGGVTLGARGIADNPQAKRHPTLGDRVQVGAFTQVFGPAHIGDDVFIGPHCTVTQDIPAGSRAVIESRLQVIRPVAANPASTIQTPEAA